MNIVIFTHNLGN